MLFEYINEKTGFAEREPFHSGSEVKKYFTVKHMEYMFGVGHGLTQGQLDEMVQLIIHKRWNIKSETSKVFSVRVNRTDSIEVIDQKITVLKGKIEKFSE